MEENMGHNMVAQSGSFQLASSQKMHSHVGQYLGMGGNGSAKVFPF